MENLNLDKFSPKKAELKELSKKYLDLKIDGVEDKKGYLVVDEARKELKRSRCEITKTGKALRGEAVSFQKAVIALEKDLVAIIEPVEFKLMTMQDKINTEIEKNARKKLLPERKERLKEIELEIEDEFILLMDDARFDSFYNEKKSEYLNEKERKIKEAEEKIRREQEIEEAKKRAREEAEQLAKEEAERKEIEAKKREEQLKKEAEEAKQLAVEAERMKAEEEKQRIISEQLAKEEAEKKEQELLEKRKNYVKFLKDNGYTEENKDNFYIEKKTDKIILYKKIKEFQLEHSFQLNQ